MAENVGEAFVEVRPDTRGFGSELQRGVSKSANRAGVTAGKQLDKGMARGFRAGGLVKAAVGVLAVKKTVDVVKGLVTAAADAEVQTKRTEAAFKRAGVSQKVYRKAMEDAGRQAEKLGFDDEVAAESLATLTRVTGKLATGKRALAAAYDVARARGISLEAATKVVTRAQFGNSRVLQQLGIRMEKSTVNVDRLKDRIKQLKEQQKGATDEDKKAIAATIKRLQGRMAEAKELDKAATARKALAAIEKTLGNQSEAFAKTTAGQLAALGERWNNLQETIGAKLLPVVSTLATTGAAELGKLATAAGPILDDLSAKISQVWQNVLPDLKGALDDYRAEIEAWVGLVVAIWQRWGDEISAATETIFRGVLIIIRTALQVISNVLKALTQAIKGDWDGAWESLKAAAQAAWDGIKALFRLQIGAIKAILRAIVDQAAQSAKEFGPKVKDAAIAELKALPDRIKGLLAAIPGVLEAAITKARPVAARIGKAIFTGITNVIAGLGTTVAAFLAAIPEKLKEAAVAAGTEALKIGQAIFNKVLEGIGDLGGAIRNKVVDAVSGLGGFIADQVSGAVNRVKAAGAKTGDTYIDGLLAQIKKRKPVLRSDLANAIDEAIRAARDRVSDLSGGLTDIIGRTIDKRKPSAPAGSSEAELAVSGAAAELAKIDREARIRELEETVQDVSKSAQERKRAELELTIARNEEQARLDEQARQDAADKQAQATADAKEQLDQRVADLTDAYNRGKLSTDDYLKQLMETLRKAVPDFGEIGTSLGSAVANSFDDQLANLALQLDALRGQETAFGEGFVAPGDVIRKVDDIGKANRELRKRRTSLADAKRTAAQRARAAASADSAGGKTITKEEQKAIDAAEKAVTLAEKQVAQQEAIIENLERIVGGGGIVITRIVR